MREIRFRAICTNTRTMTKEFVYGDLGRGLSVDPDGPVYDCIIIDTDNNDFWAVDRNTIGQYTGLKDKNGKEIFEGDIIMVRTPYRSTQTHEGDNIPNGSYTEPMEPEIDEFEATVEFKDGAFIVTDFESKVWHERDEILLKWVHDTEYTEDEIKDAIRIKTRNTDSFDFWDEPEDNSGDLQYLLGVYKPNNLFELIEYLRGVEVTGNIHENADRL